MLSARCGWSDFAGLNEIGSLLLAEGELLAGNGPPEQS
jgi:hypothetical protein